MTKDPFESLELKHAKVVDELPVIGKGSAINRLPEYQDAEAIIMKVKELGHAPNRKWAIFDKKDAERRTPAIKSFKTLLTAFAAKVRELIETQGVSKQIKLEQRKDQFFLVGKGASK